MTIIENVFLGAATAVVLGFVCFFWLLWCNEKTYKQRLQIINSVCDKNRPLLDRLGAQAAFGKVGYDDHHWALVTFRDPYRLYKPIVFGGDAEKMTMK